MQTLDLQQAATFLKCSDDTIMELARCGQLPGVKVGRKWVFVDVDLVEWLRSKYPSCHSTESETSGTTTSPSTERGSETPRAQRTGKRRNGYTTTLSPVSDNDDLQDLL
jgi:excisionase family DNA binding protein